MPRSADQQTAQQRFAFGLLQDRLGRHGLFLLLCLMYYCDEDEDNQDEDDDGDGDDGLALLLLRFARDF